MRVGISTCKGRGYVSFSVTVIVEKKKLCRVYQWTKMKYMKHLITVSFKIFCLRLRAVLVVGTHLIVYLFLSYTKIACEFSLQLHWAATSKPILKHFFKHPYRCPCSSEGKIESSTLYTGDCPIDDLFVLLYFFNEGLCSLH